MHDSTLFAFIVPKEATSAEYDYDYDNNMEALRLS